jgi:hypothetical protein
MRTAGYSGTPLAKKLGIKPGFKIKLYNPPAHYFDLFADMPEGIKEIKGSQEKADFIHYFTKEGKELKKDIKRLRDSIVPDGIIWISWPKKASKIPCNITENDVRSTALKNGLVDIKVCAVDNVWSGLKLVIRVKDR